MDFQNDLVKLTNTGSTPVVFYGADKVTLEAGKSKIVRWEFATNWLGNPELHGDIRKVRYDLARLQWGYEDGIDTDDTWDYKRPHIAVETLDGDPINMVLDDPTGALGFNGLSGSSLDIDSNDTQVLRAQLAEQRARMERIEALLVAQSASATEELNPADLNALATAADDGSGDGATFTTELPQAVPTPASAADSPKQRVR